MPRTANRFLATLLGCALSGVVPPCLAQTAGQGAAAAQARSQRVHAVVVPDRGVDPGMRIKPPRMPPRSTPVIHPPATTPDGSAVVVPR